MMFLKSFLFALFHVGLVATSIHVQRGIDDTNVLEGEKVLLTCELKDVGSRRIIWYHDETKSVLTIGRHLRRSLDLNRKGRYSIRGGGQKSEKFNLQILNSQLRDTGNYICALEEMGTIIPLSQGTLSVFPLPDDSSPRCHASYLAASPAHPLGYVDLTCSWSGPTGIDFQGEWYRNGVVLKKQSHSSSKVHLQHLLDEEEDDVTFSCLISSPHSQSWRRSCSVTPLQGSGQMVRIQPLANKEVIGHNATFKCIAKNATNVTWYLDAMSAATFMESGRFQISENNSLIILRDLQEIDNGTKLTCSAEFIDGSHISTFQILSLSTESEFESTASQSTIAFGLARAGLPKSMLLLPITGTCIVFLSILILIIAISYRKKEGERNNPLKNNSLKRRQREVLRENVRVDPEVEYPCISKEDNGGSECVREEWVHVKKASDNSTSDYKVVTGFRKLIPTPEQILPHYAKPNKSKQPETTNRDKIISLGSDNISFYENVSKHNSLTSQMSKDSIYLPTLNSEAIYEALPRVTNSTAKLEEEAEEEQEEEDKEGKEGANLKKTLGDDEMISETIYAEIEEKLADDLKDIDHVATGSALYKNKQSQKGEEIYEAIDEM